MWALCQQNLGSAREYYYNDRGENRYFSSARNKNKCMSFENTKINTISCFAIARANKMRLKRTKDVYRAPHP
jgi:hypothetical protein